MQMPDAWANPTHTVPAAILDGGEWPAAARAALLRDRLATPEDYHKWLQPGTIDMWRTTYFQVWSTIPSRCLCTYACENVNTI